MAHVVTPQGTTIVHALSQAKSLAERARQIPFVPSGIRRLAELVIAAHADARQSVLDLEGMIPPESEVF